MKVLYVYPKNDDMVMQHVTMLSEGMQNSAEVRSVNNPSDAKAIVREWVPDIVHCHGCWNYWVAKTGNSLRRNGARVVFSPQGQLEPWVMDEGSIKEKLPKKVLWEKKFAERAYSIIAFGKMEEKFLRKLKWNPRIEVIHNALITNSISCQEMCSQTFAVYQKVMDSNVLELMDEDTNNLLTIIIKAGILGDSRWTGITNDNISEVMWRRLLIYAEHQNVRNYVDYGINILDLRAPYIDTEKIDAYFPEGYKKPQTIKNVIGEFKGDETDYIVRMIRQIEKNPLLLHLIELTRELYRDNINDEKIQEVLEEKKMSKYTGRLLQILKEQTLLDEGYIKSVDVIDDGLAGQIKVGLKYTDKKQAVIVGLKRISKPGLRVFAQCDELPKVLGGVGDIPLLTRADLVDRDNGNGGIILVGSHVNKTTRQLEALRRLHLLCRHRLETLTTTTGLEYDFPQQGE